MKRSYLWGRGEVKTKEEMDQQRPLLRMFKTDSQYLLSTYFISVKKYFMCIILFNAKTISCSRHCNSVHFTDKATEAMEFK